MRRVGWLPAMVMILACAGTRGPAAGMHITPEDLLGGATLRIAPDAESVAGPDQVLTVTPEMQQFLARHVDRKATPPLKLHQLVSAIIDSRTFGVEYDDTTHTASEAFGMRKGNCLSFSNLFVAMARAAGLIVEYQEVDIPPDWTLDNDTYVLNQHVNVFVDLGRDGTRVVDFNIGDFRTTYDMDRISDARARAHYYNNIGVERMQTGDTAAALECFRKALQGNDRSFSPAWTNLGTLYLRHGDRARAEAAYVEALRVSSADLVALSNLVRLYEIAGDESRAALYRKSVTRHRWLNPYYRFELARRAYDSGRPDEAIEHLKFAIRKRPKEDRFYFLMGLTWLEKGDQETARRWLARAERVAATDALKKKYSNKIDILMRRGAARTP